MQRRNGMLTYLLAWLTFGIAVGGVGVPVALGWVYYWSPDGLGLAPLLYFACRILLTWLLEDLLDPVPVWTVYLAAAGWFSLCLGGWPVLGSVLLIHTGALLSSVCLARGGLLRQHRPAERRARAAIRRDPLNPYAFKALTDVLEQQKRCAEALEVARRWELRCPLNPTVTRRISRLQRLARQQPSRRIKPLWTGLVDAARTTALGFRTVRETLNAAVPPRWAAPLRLPGCG